MADHDRERREQQEREQRQREERREREERQRQIQYRPWGPTMWEKECLFQAGWVRTNMLSTGRVQGDDRRVSPTIDVIWIPRQFQARHPRKHRGFSGE